MAKDGTDILPNPYGHVLKKADFIRVVEKILRNTPKLNIYDSIIDMSSSLLEVGSSKKSTPYTWIIDELQPDRSERLIRPDRTVLVRAQYFEAGLQHRISCHGKLVGRTKYREYPALVLELIPPIRQISNFFIAVPVEEREIYLEIMVAGGPPEVRHVDTSIVSQMPFPAQSTRLLPQARKIEGSRIQLIDIKEYLNSLHEEKEFQEEFADIQNEDDDWLDSIEAFDDFAVDEAFDADTEVNENAALLVLEERSQRDKWRELLMPMGWRIRSTENYQDSYRVDDIDPTLMVLDIRQRGRHALELLRELREEEKFRNLQAVMMVGKRFAESRAREWEGSETLIFVRPSSPIEWLEEQITDLFPEKPKPVSYDTPKSKELSGNESVLVLEEDSLSAWSIKNTIRDGEWIVTESNDALKALQLAREMKPNLVVVDLDMPRQRGMFFLMSLKRSFETNKIPILAVSASQGKEQTEEVLRMGVRGYVVKPFDQNNLISRVRECLTEIPPEIDNDLSFNI